MAYCLRSLVQVLEEVLHPDRHHKKWVLDHHKRPQIQSLWETASFLRDFLDNSSPLIQYRISNLEDQIMDAAKQAEDTLETYLTSQLISRIKSWTRKKRRNCCEKSFSKIFKCIYPNAGDAFPISPPDLGEAVKALEDAKHEVIRIMGAQSVQRADGNVLLPVSTTRYPNHNNVVVGVTEDLKQLRSRLTSRASELDIIPIVGMGGMGKTTLARILYDEYVSSSSHFDCCAWVTVSQTFDPQQILKTLLDCLLEKTQHRDNDLVVRLHKTLYGRRYLIVLDDIWSPKAWDDMQTAFPQDNKGSRIILTTRENSVVDYVNPQCHEMHLINKDESWELLRGKVFGEESCPRVFEEVGKSIANNCGGLPLALQVIGGLLSQSNKSIDFWEHVANNVRSLITRTDDQFSGIFDWSFNHLPHYLKPCFLYMAGFKEDEEIRASKTIKLWISEGFLYPIQDKGLEEAARTHLNALVDRNLIFVRGRGKSGRAKTFGMHDILRDLCLRKAQEKKFLYFNDIEIDNLQETVQCLGRIVSVSKYPKLTPLTRSFRSYCRSEELSCLCSTLSLLRVLDFESQCMYFEFPAVILQLVNLRYLRMNNEGYIPKSISVLRNLQTLIVMNISSLAMILSNLPQLRHLEFNDMEENSKLEYGVHENLQSLSQIPTKEVKKLHGKLPNLRKLSIFGYRGDQDLLDMHCFHNLETLYCEFYYWCFHDNTLPVSLKKMTLNKCKIDQSILDAIGKLHNLQILKIVDCYCGKMDWEPCEGGFRALRYLGIYHWDLVNWLATEVHFPVLEHLVLKECDYLTEIPIEFGDIATLKILEVDECLHSVFESARRIYEDQCQFGNTDLQLWFGRLLEEEADEETLM